MIFQYGVPIVLVALAFILGRRTTILKWLPMSAETSAAWDVIRTEG
jgi:hypothetical protein